MAKLTQMEAFDLTYALVSAGKRGTELLGDSRDAIRAAYERSLIGTAYPLCYVEFPLLGKPCADLLTVFNQVDMGAKFAPGAGYGYQAMFDWFSTTNEDKNVSAGIELDLSSGVTEIAGVYLQQRTRHDLVAPFLESVDELDRYKEYEQVRERLPKGWGTAYIGLFPGRAGSPTRIGGYMLRDEQQRCAADPSYLGERLASVGFDAYDDDMLRQCSELMGMAPSLDFQFDILEDGSLGPTFGLSLSLNEARPQQAASCLKDGYGAKIMRELEDRGLADDRWKLLRDVAFARQYPYQREDGGIGLVGLCVLLNYAKVKFTNAKPGPSKFYLAIAAIDIPTKGLSSKPAA